MPTSDDKTKPDQNIDPDIDLAEDEDEASLPSEADDIDPDALAPGALGAGRSVIARHARLAPSTPGVYRMIGADGEVLYVGKAKSLKRRVASYARQTGHEARIARMIAATTNMEFVSTATETEALLLEANLIKRLRPRFNVLLRDDKSFPYILITKGDLPAQIMKHRGARNRPGDYYGPFAAVNAVNRTITALERAFLIRSCSDAVYESRTRPCPPASDQTLRRAVHRRNLPRRLRRAGRRGEGVPVRQEPRRQRIARGRHGRGERDARIRARRHHARPPCRPVGGAVPTGHQSARHRGGRRLRHPPGRRIQLHRSVLLPHRPELGQPGLFPQGRPLVRGRRRALGLHRPVLRRQAVPTLASCCRTRSPTATCLPRRCRSRVPARWRSRRPSAARRRNWSPHAAANAREALGRKLADTASQHRLLAGLATVFGLARPPQRIEVYDNSHIQGANAVGAMIVVGPEGFRKNQYRKFNIRSADLAPGDDYGMMREVLHRRFKRLVQEAPRPSPEGTADAEEGAVAAWPDLVLIDGGAGQLAAARETLVELGARRSQGRRRRQGTGPRRRPRDDLHSGRRALKTAAARPCALFHPAHAQTRRIAS